MPGRSFLEQVWDCLRVIADGGLEGVRQNVLMRKANLCLPTQRRLLDFCLRKKWISFREVKVKAWQKDRRSPKKYYLRDEGRKALDMIREFDRALGGVVRV